MNYNEFQALLNNDPNTLKSKQGSKHSSEEDNYNNYLNLLKSVSNHDDFIKYINDTLDPLISNLNSKPPNSITILNDINIKINDINNRLLHRSIDFLYIKVLYLYYDKILKIHGIISRIYNINLNIIHLTISIEGLDKTITISKFKSIIKNIKNIINNYIKRLSDKLFPTVPTTKLKLKKGGYKNKIYIGQRGGRYILKNGAKKYIKN